MAAVDVHAGGAAGLWPVEGKKFFLSETTAATRRGDVSASMTETRRDSPPLPLTQEPRAMAATEGDASAVAETAANPAAEASDKQELRESLTPPPPPPQPRADVAFLSAEQVERLRSVLQQPCMIHGKAPMADIAIR
jgi:hypothetical protein